MFKCLFCDFESQERIQTERHISKVHHKVIFLCLDCNFNCKDKNTLDEHVYSEHFDPGVNDVVYQCEHCHYKTIHKISAESHALNVHDIKLLYCAKCEFTGKTRLEIKKHFYDVHMKINSKKKVYECDFCGYYKTNGYFNFLNHLQKLHNIFRYVTFIHGHGNPY